MSSFSDRDRALSVFVMTLVVLGALIVMFVSVGRAQDSMIAAGLLDYEPVPPSLIVESVGLNLVTLEYSAASGPFTGSATLELLHDVPSEGCRSIELLPGAYAETLHLGLNRGDIVPLVGRWVSRRDIVPFSAVCGKGCSRLGG